MKIPGAASSSVPYVLVSDIEEHRKKPESLGATLMVPVTDVGMGNYAFSAIRREHRSASGSLLVLDTDARSMRSLLWNASQGRQAHRRIERGHA